MNIYLTNVNIYNKSTVAYIIMIVMNNTQLMPCTLASFPEFDRSIERNEREYEP